MKIRSWNRPLHKFLSAALLVSAILSPAGKACAEPVTGAAVKSVAANAVAMKWEALEGYQSYGLYRASSADGEYTLLKETEALEALDSGLDCGVAYYYKVRGEKTADGEIDPSEFSQAVEAVTKPGKPAVISVAGEGGQQTIMWKEIPGATSYELERSSGEGDFEPLATVKTAAYTDTSASNGVYRYRVRAVAEGSDGDTVYGDYSKPADATIGLMAVPIKAVSVNKRSVVLQIVDGNYVNVTGVDLFRTTEGEEAKYLGAIDLETYTYADTAVASGKTYEYMTRSFAVDEDGNRTEGNYSATVTVTTPAPATDDPFINAAAQLSVDVMQLTADGDANSVVSAVSMLPGLAVTARAAGTGTKEQILSALVPEMTEQEASERIAAFAEKSLNAGEIEVKQNIIVADGSEWKGKLADAGLTDSGKTEGSASSSSDKLIEGSQPSDDPKALAIVNTAGFSGSWAVAYSDMNLSKGAFTQADGAAQDAVYMSSLESQYLESADATGFIKPYSDGVHSFAAILPREGIRIDEYVRKMTGDSLLAMLMHPQETDVLAVVPRFSAESRDDMNGPLQDLGITDAFDPEKADFSSSEALHLGEVVNRASLTVDESDFVKVDNADTVAIDVPMENFVKLDRPFVYMVIDNETKLPVLIGVCLTVQ